MKRNGGRACGLAIADTSESLGLCETRLAAVKIPDGELWRIRRMLDCFFWGLSLALWAALDKLDGVKADGMRGCGCLLSGWTKGLRLISAWDL